MIGRILSTCWRPLLGFGAMGAAFAAVSPEPVPQGEPLVVLSHALAEASHARVEPGDIRWEPSRGTLLDLIAGRRVLFLATLPEDATHDVWRARVRITPEGHVLDVSAPHNLTSTPLGDDHALVVRDERAAYATQAFGQEQSVVLLDLSGEGAQNHATSFSERVMNWLTNIQRTGSGEGIGRIDLTFDDPAERVGLELRKDALAIDFIRHSTRQKALLNASGDLTTSATGLHAEPASHLPKRLSHWAVDTLRAVSWIGPAPIAWLEDKAFAVRDWARQVAFSAESSAPSELANGGEVAQAAARLNSFDGSTEMPWPPANIAPIWKTPEPGEGEWVVPNLPWLKKMPGADASTPSVFYRTYVRPDPERPYATVLLVAMDMRQLDFDMEAGSEDPEPLVGPPGTGRVPRDPAKYTRVAAAFNGAFKTEHGHYGMMVHNRVLLPPVPNAASVVALNDGSVALGTWNTAKTADGIGFPPGEVMSFRQNLDALIDHGDVNPSGRSLWGFSLPGKGAQTERSGLCVTPAGQLIYAWGDEISATSLGKAMKMAGCDYGLHLDMNPYHTGFLFMNIEELKGRKYKSELLSSDMSIPKERYIEWSPKDFFYVMVRNPAPAPITGASEWHVSDGVQPAPKWIPSIWNASIDTGDAKVELTSVDAARAEFRLRAGAREADAKATVKAARELVPADARRAVLVALAGVSAEKQARGLATDGRLVVPASGGDKSGLVVVTPVTAGGDREQAGALQIKLPSEMTNLADGADMLELPLLMNAGEITVRHESTAPRQRSALGIAPSGRVFFAQAALASDAPLAQALKRAGCVRAVLLDRGLSASGTIERTTPASGLHTRYDESAIYVIAAPMKPRAFRFDAPHEDPPAGKSVARSKTPL